MEKKMRNLLAVCAIVLFCITTSYAAPIPNEASFEQSLSLPGLDASLYGHNNEEWVHTFTDDDGTVYSHTHPKQASGNFYFTLEQGAMGSSYLPYRNNVELNLHKGQSFSVNAQFVFLLTDETPTWTAPPGSSQNWSFGSIRFGTDASIRHDSLWNDGEWTETSDITGNASFWFENAKLEWANFSVSDYGFWDNGELIPGLALNANFYGTYELESQLKQPPPSIPEPATALLLLAGGSLSLLRRSRRTPA